MFLSELVGRRSVLSDLHGIRAAHPHRDADLFGRVLSGFWDAQIPTDLAGERVRSRHAGVQRSACCWPDCPTRNADAPRGSTRSRAVGDVGSDRAVSRAEAHLIVGANRSRAGLGAVHLQGLLQGVA
jgi:hypothetical protein